MKTAIFKKLFPDNQKKWKVFTVCLLTSSVFWLFLTFSRTDETTINFKLKYLNLPEDQVRINQPPEEIDIRIQGKVFDLFEYSSNRKSTVEINVKDLEKVKRGSLTKYYISLKNNPEALLKESKSSFKVLSYSADSIHLLFDDVIEKRLPVISKVKMEYDSTAYVLYGQSVSKDSITVRGSKYLLAKMKEMPSVERTFKPTLVEPSVRIPFQSRAGVLEIIPDTVEISAKMEAIKKHQFKSDVLCQNCPDSVNLKLFPSQASLSFKSTQSSLEEARSGELKIYVDYEDLLLNPTKLQLKLADIPSGLSELKLEPAKVDYLISTK